MCQHLKLTGVVKVESMTEVMPCFLQKTITDSRSGTWAHTIIYWNAMLVILSGRINHAQKSH